MRFLQTKRDTAWPAPSASSSSSRRHEAAPGRRLVLLMSSLAKLRATPERFCQGAAEETTRNYGDIPLRGTFKKSETKDIFIPVSRQKIFPCPAFFGFPTISEREREEMRTRIRTGVWMGMGRERDKGGQLCADRRKLESESRVERLLEMGEELTLEDGQKETNQKKDLRRRP